MLRDVGDRVQLLGARDDTKFLPSEAVGHVLQHFVKRSGTIINK
jgi:hypothetical protein